MTMTDLSAKRIVVTGGSTGIGRATLASLAGEGATIVTCARHAEPLDAAVREAGGTVRGVVADIATPDGIDTLFAAVDADPGGIDMLVACAALGADPIVAMDDPDWRYVIDTNLAAYLACAKAAMARMGPDGGHLLFVGSISTEIKAVGESVYAATKAGVQAFAETLRKEVAERNIKVSVIQPGSVDSEMQQCSPDEKRAAIAAGEMLPPEEIAEAIRFVLTRSASCDIVNLRIEPIRQKTS